MTTSRSNPRPRGQVSSIAATAVPTLVFAAADGISGLQPLQKHRDGRWLNEYYLNNGTVNWDHQNTYSGTSHGNLGAASLTAGPHTIEIDLQGLPAGAFDLLVADVYVTAQMPGV